MGRGRTGGQINIKIMEENSVTLPTYSHLNIAPPLTVTVPDVPLERLRAGVGVGYAAHLGLLNLRGQSAGALAQQVYGAAIDAVGAVVPVSDGLLARLRRDEIALLSPCLPDALERLQSADSALTITDVTHGRGFLVLVGARALNVLPKVCGLNLSDTAFPDHHAAQTMLAKVRALLIRADAVQLPAYHIIVDRSLAAYVWDVLLEAAQEFDGVTISADQLKTSGVGAGL